MGVIDRLERRVAQALLGATFIKLGFDAAIAPGSRADKAAAIGLPSAELAVRANGAAMMAGGAALTLDKLPRLAALGLITSMIPATWPVTPTGTSMAPNARPTKSSSSRMPAWSAGCCWC
jgi:uncharacterized membrane protein YphA (DoxX/SURF4 family)